MGAARQSRRVESESSLVLVARRNTSSRREEGQVAKAWPTMKMIKMTRAAPGEPGRLGSSPCNVSTSSREKSLCACRCSS